MNSEEVGGEWLSGQLCIQDHRGVIAYQVQEDKVGFRFKGITLVLALWALEQPFLSPSVMVQSPLHERLTIVFPPFSQ